MPKTSRQRPKINFAVDRDEIDISSDWVPEIVQPLTPAPVPVTAVPDRTAAPAKGRLITRVQHGLTPGQFAVYRALYDKGEPTEDGARTFRGGYAQLCELTGLCKRGIQNVRRQLQQKHAIRIRENPGFDREQTTVYEVLDEAALLMRWKSLGLLYACGKGKILSTVALLSTVSHNSIDE